MQTLFIIEYDGLDWKKVKSFRLWMAEEKEKMSRFKIILVINIPRR